MIKNKAKEGDVSQNQMIQTLFEKGHYSQLRQRVNQLLNNSSTSKAEAQSAKDQLSRSQLDPQVLMIGLTAALVVMILAALAVYVSR